MDLDLEKMKIVLLTCQHTTDKEQVTLNQDITSEKDGMPTSAHRVLQSGTILGLID